MAEERRHNRRLTFAASCSLTTAGNRCPAQLIDLSLNGALVQSEPADVKLGTSTTLHVQLGEAATVTIAIEMEIASVHGDKLGLRRKSIDLESLTHLRRVLELNLGSAELMDREISEMIGTK
jgi:PilZ domain